MRIVLTLGLIWSIVASTAQKPIETTAKITGITVYPSAAEVHYQKELTLNKGKNAIVFTGLTPHIIENTVNITPSSKDVAIITVTEKYNYIKEKRALPERIAAVKDSIERIEQELDFIAVKTDILHAEKARLFKDESIGGVSKGVDVDEIEKASEFFRKRYTDIAMQLYRLGQKETRLTYRSDQFSRQLKQLSVTTSHSTSEIMLVVTSPSKQRIKFDFKFLTEKGGWAPMYDFKYNGPDQPLEFNFRANVFNSSGTPWKDVSIKLSTADPIKGFDMPSLASANKARSGHKVDGVEFREVQVMNAIAEYSIKHKYSIPSDAKPYLVDVEEYKMAASFNYLLIPKLDPFGFLMAKIPNWNQYNLIPGTTNVYNHGTYMGKTFLNTYAENDTLGVFLGKDKTIQTTWKEEIKEHPRNFVGNYSVEKTKVSITIKSNSDQPIPIEILDQVPVYDGSDKVKFNVTGIDDAEYFEPDGLLTWKTTIPPRGNKSIDFQYEIKIPKDFYEANGGYRSFYKVKHKAFRVISCPSF